MTDRHRADVRDFLATRRARISPQQAGLPTYGHRRVPGLRREEVATIAGVSAEYYARLERGNLAGVSESVLEAISRALQLDDAERAHLFDLARAAQAGSAPARRPTTPRVRPVVQHVLDAFTGGAALVRNGRLDYLGANRLGLALFAPMFDGPARGNSARFTFLDPKSAEFYPAWERAAKEMVAGLRGEAGRNPHDRGLQDLVGELSTRSHEFRTMWAAHDVRMHRTGSKTVHHPVVGPIELSYEAMALSADTDMTLNVFVAAPDSPSAEALGLLDSWTAASAPHPALSRTPSGSDGT